MEKESAQKQKQMSDESPQDLPRSLVAEFAGTFFLTFADCGIAMTGELSGHKPDLIIAAITPALLVASMIYSIGHVSGAHINPAVTLAFALRKVFKWNYAVLYWISQVSGAIVAALVLNILFGPVKDLGTTHTHIAPGTTFFLECILTCLLITVILGTATKHKTIGAESAMAVAAAIAVCGLIGKQLSDVSMNPARSIGPALISGSYSDLWIYVLAPFTASFAAVALTWAIQGPIKEDERISANGEGHDS